MGNDIGRVPIVIAIGGLRDGAIGVNGEDNPGRGTPKQHTTRAHNQATNLQNANPKKCRRKNRLSYEAHACIIIILQPLHYRRGDFSCKCPLREASSNHPYDVQP
jgi:hypothetical protein